MKYGNTIELKKRKNDFITYDHHRVDRGSGDQDYSGHFLQVTWV